MAVRSSTSVGAGFDPEAYAGEVETLTPDDMHELFMSFGPEGPPAGFDMRSVAMDGSRMSPKKRLRGTGFPAEDAPFDDYAMMPMPYESAPEPDFRADSYTGAMTKMPGIKEGDGRMWSGVTGELMTPKPKEEPSTTWTEAGEHLGYGSEEELDYARSVGMAPPKGLELPKGYTKSLRRELAGSTPTKHELAGYESADDYYRDSYGKEYIDDPWRRHGFGSWSEIL